MSQVSRIALSADLEKEIVSSFRSVITHLQTDHDVTDFLDELLTPTEKIMLAKRLAIAFLLDKNYDYRTIMSILKVSTATVSSVNKQYAHNGRGYKRVIAMMQSSEQWKQVLNRLDVTLEEVFSPKAWHRRVYGSTSDKD
jgi:uncharacterized protein YerC